MSDIQCNRTDCFYLAKGRCTSITALDAEGCTRFRAKKQARTFMLPRRLDLAMTRWRLVQASLTDQQINAPAALATSPIAPTLSL